MFVSLSATWPDIFRSSKNLCLKLFSVVVVVYSYAPQHPYGIARFQPLGHVGLVSIT